MYLAEIGIKNFRGIKELKVEFTNNINIIIGENGLNKTALIDAIRILFNLGNNQKDIYIRNEDFHVDENLVISNLIELSYTFKSLTADQKGAFYEYLVLGETPEKDEARITLQYERREDTFPLFSYTTGIGDGQRAERNTLDLFNHYYLGALRDSTRDLVNSKDSLLGKVIKRIVQRNKSEEKFKDIINSTNNSLLEQDEISDTKTNVNTNIDSVFTLNQNNRVGLRIDQSNIDAIVNSIKPFLPFDKTTLTGNGFNLYQNSLGFNNIIYIATVLSDIKERIQTDKISHFALLIEEPEAHLHPQLQLNLYNFLKATNNHPNSQLFISTHSPTLTSKVDLDDLNLIEDKVYNIGNCFEGRASESIRESHRTTAEMTESDFSDAKLKLERYIDVTKSQLFFSSRILIIEGITEELLIPEFASILGKSIVDYQIELVNVQGTSFKPFIHLFNSSNPNKKIPKKVSIISDGDEFTESKNTDFNFEEIINLSTNKLEELFNGIKSDEKCGRIKNLELTKNGQESIFISTAVKTFEFELCRANIADNKSDFESNLLVDYIKTIDNSKVSEIASHIAGLNDPLTQDDKFKIALLLWKVLPSKAEFAQNFSTYLRTTESALNKPFNIPEYIKEAFNHLTEE